MNLPFIYTKTYYFNSVENFYVKIHQAYFNNFKILFETVRHRKIGFLQPRFF